MVLTESEKTYLCSMAALFSGPLIHGKCKYCFSDGKEPVKPKLVEEWCMLYRKRLLRGMLLESHALSDQMKTKRIHVAGAHATKLLSLLRWYQMESLKDPLQRSGRHLPQRPDAGKSLSREMLPKARNK